MIIYSIYKIVNHINGKIYIGMTRQEDDKRFKQHIAFSKITKPQLLIQTKIKEYGEDNFSFTIIFQTKVVEIAREMEAYFIKEHNSLVPIGYNIHSGGNYCDNYASFSEEVKKRISQKMKMNNPGCTKESIEKKTSIIQAKNYITNECLLITDRKKFAEDNNIPYTSIGWAIQHEKTLRNGWHFTYVKKRVMGA